MNKKKFLRALSRRLKGMNREEREATLAYYAEMIDDGVENGLNEQSAVAGLGDIDEIAAQLQPEEKKHPRKRIGGKRLLVLLVVLALLMGGVCVARIVNAENGIQAMTVEEPFASISISGLDADVRLLPTEDGACEVRYSGKVSGGFHAAVEDDVLRIEIRKNWFDRMIGLDFQRDALEILLPERELASVAIDSAGGDVFANGLSAKVWSVNSASGDIALENIAGEGLSASSASGIITLTETAFARETILNSASGAINASGLCTDVLNLRSASGSICMMDLDAGQIAAVSSSGGIFLRGTAESLFAESDSGTVELAECVISGEATIHTASGDVLLSSADAGELLITTASGKVMGYLHSGKAFEAYSESGYIDLPPSVPGAGSCHIETESGDISIVVKN